MWAGGGGRRREGGGRSAQLKTRTPHKDVGKNQKNGLNSFQNLSKKLPKLDFEGFPHILGPR